jgi:hypothetical protein
VRVARQVVEVPPGAHRDFDQTRNLVLAEVVGTVAMLGERFAAVSTAIVVLGAAMDPEDRRPPVTIPSPCVAR